MTYFEENKLVDEDFPEDSSQKVKELISFLSEPEILVKENNMHPKHCDLLGDELLECLSWRRGALLYMYCHSLTKRREWLTRKSSLLKKYLVDGISYLLQMLNFRCPIQLNEGVSFQDLDTAKLLSEGIFSDIHLLAMMYSGEMCYWGLKHCADQQPENHEVDTGVSGASYTTHKEPLDFREVGEKILKKKKKRLRKWKFQKRRHIDTEFRNITLHKDSQHGYYPFLNAITIFHYIFFLFKKKKRFFLMWTIFKVFTEFITLLLLFYVLVFWP
ncbi:UPF0600 protein C5orf51 homolog isoform X3 [Monodon monoceros]|nr:UPF0600 protein C5orf51 homolog isoform X3 [Monodon monoceros]